MTQFVEAYNLHQDTELAAHFDKECAAMIAKPPALPPVEVPTSSRTPSDFAELSPLSSLFPPAPYVADEGSHPVDVAVDGVSLLARPESDPPSQMSSYAAIGSASIDSPSIGWHNIDPAWRSASFTS